MESLTPPGDGGIVDLSHSLENGMQVYPGDPVFHSRSHAYGKPEGPAQLSEGPIKNVALTLYK